VYLELYDYIKGTPISRVIQLDFGDLIQNQHCISPIVFRIFADSENSISNLKIFLESTGSNNNNYGYYISSDFEPSIESGSELLSNHFTEVPNATSLSPGGVEIPNSDSRTSYWVWIDVQSSDRSGIIKPNFRFFYEFD
jgi:hypothetical protein